jgi:hypothetical protein
MGFRFRRSFGGHGARLNIGKRGISTSFGVRGAGVTFGRRTTEHVGIPGAGLSYVTSLSSGRRGRIGGDGWAVVRTLLVLAILAGVYVGGGLQREGLASLIIYIPIGLVAYKVLSLILDLIFSVCGLIFWCVVAPIVLIVRWLYEKAIGK